MATFKLSPIPRIPSPGARDFEAQIGNVLSHLPTLAAEIKDIAEATVEAAVLVDAEGNATIAATGASQAALSATSAVNASTKAAESLAAIKAEATKATKAKSAAELAASQAGINALAASDNAVRAETAAATAVEAATTTATSIATTVATEVAAQVVGGMTTEASISAAAAAESQRQAAEALTAVVAAAQDAEANALAAAENASTATTAASTANNHAQQANLKAGSALSSQQLADAAAKRAADVAAGVQTLLDNLTAGPVVMVNGKFGAVQLVPSDIGLGDVDNTSDASKPISTLTQTALNAKQDTLVSGINIKTLNGASLLGAGNIDIVGAKPSLQGDPAPYVTQTKTYQITNFNSFSAYSVTASAGTASISGDTITFTAPGTPGSVSLTLTVDGAPTVFVITVQPAGVLQPTNASPANGATGIGGSPALQSSAFATAGATDTHLASRWTVYQGGTQVHSSGWRTDAKTSYTVPAGVMAVSTGYTWTVEHRGNALGDSPASTATGFTTAATFNSYIPTPTATPANFGDALEGGFYAGMVWGQLTQSATSTTIGTGSKTFTVPSMTSAPIVYAGQTLEVRSRANPANKMIGTVTGAVGTSLTINVTSIGGSGTFSDWSVMARHRIIVAPKASGEHAGIALKNAKTALPTACQTLTEGFAATQAMRDADTSTVYPAAHWARNLNIGGRTDWYIPARDELELCWRNLKPVTNNNYASVGRPTGASFNYANNGSYGDTANTHGTNNNSAPVGATYTASVPGQTAATAFRTGGTEAYEFGLVFYWSSSDYDASLAWSQYWYSSYAGVQNSGDGTKTNPHRVRAVRRSVI